MSLVGRNIVANTASRFFTALLGFLLLPLYVKFLGVEAYGLVGFYTTLAALFALLEMGMSATLNREIAKLSAAEDASTRMRDLLRTLEVVAAGLALFVGLTVAAASPLIARYWIQSSELPLSSVQQSVMLMGICTALQFPERLYSSGLVGLQRQVLRAVVSGMVALVRGAGVLTVLLTVSCTIECFFAWHVVTGVLGAVVWRLVLGNCLPPVVRPTRFRREILVSLARYSAGISGITLFGLLLRQTDKVVLSKLLTLDEFGYYTMAAAAAGTLYCLIGPVFTAVFPRLTQLAARNDEAGLSRVYHLSCQIMSVLILPPALVLAFYSRDFLHLWLSDLAIAQHTHSVLSLLVIGTMLNGLMNIPYALQLANGWTRLALLTNAFAVILLVPLTIILALVWGPQGAASAWVALNTIYLFVTAHFMHRRILPDDKWKWYLEDVGAPLTAALLSTSIVYWVTCSSNPSEGRIVAPLLAALAAVISAFLAARRLRTQVAIRIFYPFAKRIRARVSPGSKAGAFRQ